LIIFAMDQVIQLNPKFAPAYCSRGGAKIDLKKFDEGLADGKKSVELDTNHPQGHYIVGYAFWGQNKFPEGIAEENEAIRLSPQYAAAYLVRGGCYEGTGNLDSAIADYRLAVQYDPNSQVAQDLLKAAQAKKNGTPQPARITHRQ
jgi:tetratricopeptide (TPR) repeat protein